MYLRLQIVQIYFYLFAKACQWLVHNYQLFLLFHTITYKHQLLRSSESQLFIHRKTISLTHLPSGSNIFSYTHILISIFPNINNILHGTPLHRNYSDINYLFINYTKFMYLYFLSILFTQYYRQMSYHLISNCA